GRRAGRTSLARALAIAARGPVASPGPGARARAGRRSVPRAGAVGPGRRATGARAGSCAMRVGTRSRPVVEAAVAGRAIVEAAVAGRSRVMPAARGRAVAVRTVAVWTL